MNDTTTPASKASPPVGDDPVAAPVAAARSTRLYAGVSFGVLAVVGFAALALAWQAWQKVRDLEREQAQRAQAVQSQSTEARVLARQAQGSVLETAAKVTLLEARLAEVAVHRSQTEDLLQSLTQARDENLLVDIESAVLVSLQQSALVGSADPLANALRRADERLARYRQPRLEAVRRAIARDLDVLRATAAVDIAALNINLDEAVRMINELPLLSQAATRNDEPDAAAPQASSARTAAPSPSAYAHVPTWLQPLFNASSTFAEQLWSQAKSLVRVTRIEHPEAVLMAPEHAFFLRENLKLRLLSARLALLSRQFGLAQSDLRMARISLERYFDRGSRDFAPTLALIRQATDQAQQVELPQPSHTLAALSAAARHRAPVKQPG
ncbi:MAG: uroporphyrinogen-III C-methyltransferase [Burkholderiaceae bacterium]|nr:uroporphyrinogen-III C-methyltransferase [Burkholderiaceae bacterium]